jgi:hypothetical protein
VTRLNPRQPEDHDTSTTHDAIPLDWVSPTSVHRDQHGHLWICDGHAICRYAPNGILTIIAGAQRSSGHIDGDVKLARFNHPRGICMDSHTSHIYVADSGNASIRIINMNTNMVTTMKQSSPTYVYGEPVGVILDGHGRLYITDAKRHCVIMINLDSTKAANLANIHVIAGTIDHAGHQNTTPHMPSTQSTLFNRPYGIAIRCDDGHNVQLYVTDTLSRCLRRIDLCFTPSSLLPSSSLPSMMEETKTMVSVVPVHPSSASTPLLATTWVEKIGRRNEFGACDGHAHTDNESPSSWSAQLYCPTCRHQFCLSCDEIWHVKASDEKKWHSRIIYQNRYLSRAHSLMTPLQFDNLLKAP